MSVSKRDTANTESFSMDHDESKWNDMPGRGEIAVSAWQQAHTQSPSEAESLVPESETWAESEGCPQHS